MTDYVSDATLLERFAQSREQDAFAALVRRHGPRVLGACRHVLRDEHEAEDVFQATFLVLARKASAGIAWRDSVEGWLCAVALRLARHARSGNARKRRREAPFASMPDLGEEFASRDLAEEHHPRTDPVVDITRRELRQVLDDELERLPEKYRAPLVLCYLEGKTNEEAARQLGWPSGSMSRRLQRARVLLRPRLARRGITLPLVLVCVGLAGFAGWNGTRQARNALAIRAAMAPLKSLSWGREGLSNAGAETSDHSEPAADWEHLASLARRASLVAERMEKLDPPKAPERWNGFVDEMGASAKTLGAAVEKQDEEAAREAAKRLKAACVKCHVAFRD